MLRKEFSAYLVQNQVNRKQVDQVLLYGLAPPFQIQNGSTVITNVLSELDWWNSPMVLLSMAVVYVRCVQGEFIEKH